MAENQEEVMNTKESTSEDSGVDISPEKNGGVLKKILNEGEGDECPGIGSEVFVHYTGKLTNGEKFDSSKDRDQLFSFTLGEGKVIKGWDIGVATMKKGEACLLTCAPEYAYGAAGSPPKIPANSTLVFEVELFYWKDMDLTNDGGVIKKCLMKGEGTQKPKDDANVKVHIRGTYQGTVFEEKDVSFILGEGHESGICEAIEKALPTMKKREKALLTIQPKYGFGDKGSENFGIPANSEICYEVYLSSFENPKESYQMNVEEKIQTSEKIKEKGTKYFKASDFKRALAQYEKMIDILNVYQEEDKPKTNPMKCIAYLNAALCDLKTNQFSHAKTNCNKALEIEANNVKGLFRRGQAHVGLADFELAKADFLALLKIEPANKAARNQLNIAVFKIKQEFEKEKRKYGNMFDKFAEQDERKRASEKRNQPAESDVIKQAAEEAKKAEEEENAAAEKAGNGDVDMKE
eukprot:gene18009-19810_t